ncbi:MAG: phenylalanine 4-monooxygenase [Pseudomonadota bacterium]
MAKRQSIRGEKQLMGALNEHTPARNRYADAPRRADYTIDQAWDTYSAAEHDRWRRLCARQRDALRDRACPQALAGLAALGVVDGGVPHLERLSDRLEALTGWRVLPVADLVPDAIFFDHLANRRFPAGAYLRPEREIDYIEEPDIFHDVFGHAPLLADPAFADFMQAYGIGAKRAAARGQLHHLARLYWYTVEYGLIQTEAGLRVFGAGLLSSPSECVYALEANAPARLRFDIERVMRTRYVIDSFQKAYFVVEDMERLSAQCRGDFGDLYGVLRSAADIEAGGVLPTDELTSHIRAAA